MAKEEGYSEPDPRVDLSGQDVLRKLVILAREAGYRIEQSDVQKDLFIPESILRVHSMISGKRFPNSMPSLSNVVGRLPHRGNVSVSLPLCPRERPVSDYKPWVANTRSMNWKAVIMSYS